MRKKKEKKKLTKDVLYDHNIWDLHCLKIFTLENIETKKHIEQRFQIDAWKTNKDTWLYRENK